MTCGCSTIFPKRMYRSSVTLLKLNLHIQRKRQLSVTKMKINYKTHPMDENSVVLNILLHCPSILEENLDPLDGMMNSKDPVCGLLLYWSYIYWQTADELGCVVNVDEAANFGFTQKYDFQLYNSVVNRGNPKPVSSRLWKTPYSDAISGKILQFLLLVITKWDQSEK